MKRKMSIKQLFENAERQRRVEEERRTITLNWWLFCAILGDFGAKKIRVLKDGEVAIYGRKGGPVKFYPYPERRRTR